MRVLAVDPGREKCGVAVCASAGVLAHRVVPTDRLAAVVGEWTAAYGVKIILVGNRTGSAEARARLGDLGVAVEQVEEQGTTLAARRRYFRDHPPRGLRGFLPISLQVPPEPYDDYAAILLAEAYLAAAGLPGTVCGRPVDSHEKRR